MIPSLENIETCKEILLALGWLLPRVLAAFAMLPLFNHQILPGLLRNSIALAICVIMVPVIREQLHTHPAVSTQLMMFLLMKEALIGLTLGFFMAIPFWGLEAVGFFIDNQRGASIASSFNPLTGNDSSPLGIMFNQSFMVYFLVSGGFGLMLTVLYQSYLIWSPLEFFTGFHYETPLLLIAQLDRLMALGIVLSAPVILVMFLAELGLAFISRFAPQLQVFFLAMPIKSGVAVFMLTVYIGTLFRYTNEEITQYRVLLPYIREIIR